MSSLGKFSAVLGAAVLAVAAVSAGATTGEAKGSRTRLQCDARGAGHIALHSRYEERARPKRTRKKFKAEFEALAGGGFTAGQRVAFTVDSVVVGTATLVSVVGGEVAAELELDSNANAHNGKTPFPGNFPAIAAGSAVEASVGGRTVLGCEVD